MDFAHICAYSGERIIFALVQTYLTIDLAKKVNKKKNYRKLRQNGFLKWGGGGGFSVEPKEKITIPKSDDDDDDLIIHGVDGGTKSELDKIHGDPNIDATNDSMTKDSVSKQLLLICVITVS